MKYAKLEDIARRANKSMATVSRVLNGKAQEGISISPATIEQVMKIAEELNYRPNFMAKNLVERDSRVVGLIVPDIMQSFFNEICYYLSRDLDRDGYDLILSHSYEDPEAERRSIGMLLSRRVSGIVIAPAMGQANRELLLNIRSRRIPLILLDRNYSDESFYSVTTEDMKGFYDLTEHIIQQGARRIMFIAGNNETSVTIERVKGYKKALADYGLEVRNDLIIPSGYFLEDGYAAVQAILKEGTLTGIDAIAGVNDAVAIGILKALEEEGLRVPGDILVGGYANDRYSDFFKVPLTTVDQPKQLLAEKTFTMLMQLIRGEDVPEAHVRVPCSLKVRSSTFVQRGVAI